MIIDGGKKFNTVVTPLLVTGLRDEMMLPCGVLSLVLDDSLLRHMHSSTRQYVQSKLAIKSNFRHWNVSFPLNKSSRAEDMALWKMGLATEPDDPS